MAYANYTFYTETFHGDAVPEDSFERYAERASDFVDVVTFDRMADGIPGDDRQQARVKKAVCAAADVLYQIDLAQKQAIAAASGSSSITTTGTGTSTGIVTSMSSGSESISYATPQQMGSSAKEWSAVYTAAGDTEKTNSLLLKTVMPYLMGVRTDDGIPVLFAGMR